MIALGLLLATTTALRMPAPLSPRNASYRIEARLAPEDKRIDGSLEITWQNPSDTAATELAFHLYMNAFKNERSQFYIESRGQHRGNEHDPHGWGSIDVTALSVDGVDLQTRAIVEDTILKVTLPQPIAGHATAKLTLKWNVHLPKVFARTGLHEDFFAITQWFPKIAVFDGTWRAHQHHLTTEFFSDYGVYDVTFDLPRRFVVAATGIPMGEEALANDYRRLRYHAEDVHDFALIAYPHFVVHETQYRDALGTVDVRFYSVPSHADNAERHIAATLAGLAELSARLGPYPYSMLSVLDVPFGAEGAGGMEYPTLFLTFDLPTPEAVHWSDAVTAHELSHQYFYGIVGSDEVEEAWLDEGFTEMMTSFLMEKQFGTVSGAYTFLGRHMSYLDQDRLRYRSAPSIDPIATRAFEFLDGRSYGLNTYAKTTMMMRQTERILGPEVFQRALRHYYDTWKFRHPRRADFIAAFDEGAGRDLTRWWHQVLETTDTLDYSVKSATTRALSSAGGFFDSDGGAREEREAKPFEPARHEYEVIVQRRGQIALPVEVKLVFSDGSEKLERWDDDGSGPAWRRYLGEGPHALRYAEVDPKGELVIDVDRWNNSRTANGDSKPRARAFGRWQLLAATLLTWVGL